MSEKIRKKHTGEAGNDGQFGTVEHSKSDVDLGSTLPWLSQCKIKGFTRKVFQAAPDAPVQPGGTCANCGTAIINCYVVEDTKTGTVHDIGSDCAERVGMNREELARHWRDWRAARRLDEAEARRRKWDAETEAREAAITAEYGEHGTLSRLEYGCTCEDCAFVAPHGHPTKYLGGCTCEECSLGIIESDDRYFSYDKTYLVDLETGQVRDDIRMVSTQYGSKWCVKDDDGDSVRWITPSPKRRGTMTKHGFTEVSIPTVWRKKRDGDSFPLHRYGEMPEFDNYGEPLGSVTPG